MGRFVTTTLAVLSALLLSQPTAAQCPDYVKGRDTTSNWGVSDPSEIPTGFLLYRIDYQDGLYRTAFNPYSSSVVPGTENDAPAQIDISDDGNWVFYIDMNENRMVVQRLDGSGRATNWLYGCYVGGFYRQSPQGSEIFYLDGNSRIMAMQVDLTSQDAVFVGNSTRTIADLQGDGRFNNSRYWDGSTSVVANHIHGRYDRDGFPYFGRTSFWTIPNGGNGTAGVSNMREWLNEDWLPAWGCGHTMSHDGSLALANDALIGRACTSEGDGEVGQCLNDDGTVYGSACLPSRRSVILHYAADGTTVLDTQRLDHKGFYITSFWEDDQANVAVDDIVDKYAASVNWAPPAFRRGEYDQVDFSSWHFSNDPRFVTGVLRGNALRSLNLPNALWVVDWTTNKWYRITPSDFTDPVDDPAMYITDLSAVRRVQRPSSMVAPRNTASMATLNRGTIRLEPWAKGFALYTVDGRLVWQFQHAPSNSIESIALPASVARTDALIVKYLPRQ